MSKNMIECAFKYFQEKKNRFKISFNILSVRYIFLMYMDRTEYGGKIKLLKTEIASKIS